MRSAALATWWLAPPKNPIGAIGGLSPDPYNTRKGPNLGLDQRGVGRLIDQGGGGIPE